MMVCSVDACGADRMGEPFRFVSDVEPQEDFNQRTRAKPRTGKLFCLASESARQGFLTCRCWQISQECFEMPGAMDVRFGGLIK